MKNYCLAAALVLFTISTAAKAQDGDAPLNPLGQWRAKLDGAGCEISRVYREEKRKLRLSFRQSAGASSIQISLIFLSRTKKTPHRFGKAKIALMPDAAQVEGDFQAHVARANLVHSISVERRAISGLAGARSIRFTTDEGVSYHFALPEIASGMKIVSDCEESLLRGWGIDPIAFRAQIRPAKAIAATSWLKPIDYPASAVRNRVSGTAHALVRVDMVGRVCDCVIVKSSGSKALDERTCMVIRSNGKFEPALGSDGAPVDSVAAMAFRWSLS